MNYFIYESIGIGNGSSHRPMVRDSVLAASRLGLADFPYLPWRTPFRKCNCLLLLHQAFIITCDPSISSTSIQFPQKHTSTAEGKLSSRNLSRKISSGWNNIGVNNMGVVLILPVFIQSMTYNHSVDRCP